MSNSHQGPGFYAGHRASEAGSMVPKVVDRMHSETMVSARMPEWR